MWEGQPPDNRRAVPLRKRPQQMEHPDSRSPQIRSTRHAAQFGNKGHGDASSRIFTWNSRLPKRRSGLREASQANGGSRMGLGLGRPDWFGTKWLWHPLHAADIDWVIELHREARRRRRSNDRSLRHLTSLKRRQFLEREHPSSFVCSRTVLPTDWHNFEPIKEFDNV
jgi:hypothetical protein